MKTPKLLLLIPALAACLISCGNGADRKPIVVLLGFDGADWHLIDPLIEKGRLPLFKKLKEQGAWGILRTSTPAKSPIIWTSIATGMTKAKHGIEDFRSKKINARGKLSMNTALEIRQPPLWEMLDANGRRSVLVNWYLSYPPQPLNGVNVSDYFRMRAFQPRDSKRGRTDDTVFPSARAAEFEGFIDKDYAEVLRATGLPDFPRQFDALGKDNDFSRHGIFKKYPEFVLQETLVQKVASELFRKEDFDLFALYFKLPDIVQHFAFDCLVDESYKKKLLDSFADPVAAEREQKAAYEKVADIVYPVYRNAENIIREYLESRKFKDAYFVIVSDHGFYFFVRNGTVQFNHVNGLEKPPDGICLIAGPGVKPGKITLPGIYDIAPTVLYLLGLPLNRDMDGQPLFKAFSFRNPIRYTEYKKKKPQFVKRNRELDERALQELKALGYIN